jgi:hypothetical protein
MSLLILLDLADDVRAVTVALLTGFLWSELLDDLILLLLGIIVTFGIFISLSPAISVAAATSSRCYLVEVALLKSE